MAKEKESILLILTPIVAHSLYYIDFNMARKLDESEKKQMNLDTLQKEDPDITDILGNASHTAIYRFNNGSCQWERVGVEGAAFVVAASVRPLFRLVVFNKLGEIW